MGKAIKSMTTELASKLPVAASHFVAGDETTWDEATEERRAAGAEGPPLWHADREVVVELTPAQDPKTSHRRQSLEQPPIGHMSRRQDGRRPSKSTEHVT
jgi:hypothetical protein